MGVSGQETNKLSSLNFNFEGLSGILGVSFGVPIAKNLV